MAELRPVAKIENRRPLGPEDGILFELDLASKHLDMLILQGAELCFPASIAQARNRDTRITRAVHGGLELDGRNDLYIQQEFLSQIEMQLDISKRSGGCNGAYQYQLTRSNNKPPIADDINAAMGSMTSKQYSFIRKVKVNQTAPFVRKLIPSTRALSGKNMPDSGISQGMDLQMKTALQRNLTLKKSSSSVESFYEIRNGVSQ
jgi:hypothetical protein